MERRPQIKLSLILLVCASLFTACDTEELSNDQTLETAALTSKTAANKETLIVPTSLESYADCSTVCIEQGSGNYYKKTGMSSLTNGQNTKTVSYEAYNTETDFVVAVTYAITSGNSNAEADITITIDGNSMLFEDVPKGTTKTHTVALPNGWEACDTIAYSILQEGLGNPISFSGDYALIGVCEVGCEESFSYVKNEDDSYTFTYISAEDMASAEVKFTCPHISGFEALDGKTYSVNPGNSKGSPTVLTYNGDIEACTPITFTLAFDADCDQNSGGFANLFTDFKVNGVSKKGDNPTIKFSCTE